MILPGPLQPADPLKMLNGSIQVLGAARDQILIQPLTQVIVGLEAFAVIFDGGADIRRQRIDAVKNGSQPRQSERDGPVVAPAPPDQHPRAAPGLDLDPADQYW